MSDASGNLSRDPLARVGESSSEVLSSRLVDDPASEWLSERSAS